MLVITDVKYDVHEDRQRGEYLEYAPLTFEPITLRPPQGDLSDWSLPTERVIPQTYVFTLPKQDVAYSNRVKALKPFGLNIDEVSNYNSDTLINCSIQIGVVGSRDENVVLTILKLLQEAADEYLSQMMAANQKLTQCSKSSAKLLHTINKMMVESDLVREASFWQRLKWLFTGVKGRAGS